ncbi:protein ALP1-like [Limulus polyphemus]|uniref:Protein ALP1-like n=1 Tax=Limulus polyphemus TaxID=6850 RepID=A0ABM1BQB3_LIMPO|nr:protein ALP1-like [Limulus polyphemus]
MTENSEIMEDIHRSRVAVIYRLVEHLMNSFQNNARLMLQDNTEMQNLILHYQEQGPLFDSVRRSYLPNFDISDFKSHFRVNRNTFEVFVNRIGRTLSVGDHQAHPGGKPPVPVNMQCMMFLWYIGNQETFKSMSERFTISKSTAHAICRRVNEAIQKTLMPELITWPREDGIQDIKNGFSQLSRLPNIIGALDGIHIPIRAPKANKESYFNKKRFHSIVLQGVCDSRLLFTHIYTGCPGSTQDADVFTSSVLYLEQQEYFPEDSFIVADSAYPLLPWVITPYRDYGILTQEQKVFNKELNKARIAIDHAFGQLKSRFRRLTKLEGLDMQLLVGTIVSGCVLHNLCVMADDEMYDETDVVEVNEINECIYADDESGIEVRDYLLHLVND